MTAWRVVCRSCDGESSVTRGMLNEMLPDACRYCHSTDLVDLADLTREELAEVERESA